MKVEQYLHINQEEKSPFEKLITSTNIAMMWILEVSSLASSYRQTQQWITYMTQNSENFESFSSFE